MKITISFIISNVNPLKQNHYVFPVTKMKTINVYHQSSKLLSITNIFFFILLSVITTDLLFFSSNKFIASLRQSTFFAVEAVTYSNTLTDSFEGKFF